MPFPTRGKKPPGTFPGRPHGLSPKGKPKPLSPSLVKFPTVPSPFKCSSLSILKNTSQALPPHCADPHHARPPISPIPQPLPDAHTLTIPTPPPEASSPYRPLFSENYPPLASHMPSLNLRCIQVNLQKKYAALVHLLEVMLSEKIDLAFVQEPPQLKSPLHSQFRVLVNLPSQSRSWIISQKHIDITPMASPSGMEIDLCLATLKTQSSRLLISSIYLDCTLPISHYSRAFQYLKNKSKPTLVCMDANAWHPS